MTTEPLSQVPLRRWRVRRFKSVVEADLELAQLTLIAGRNSSGKSSLIQSILLLAQAARQNPTDQAFTLNGSLVTLGGVEQVRSFSALGTEREIELGANFQFAQTRRPRQRPGRGAASIQVDWNLALGGAPPNRPGAATIVGNRVDVETPGDALSISLERNERTPRERQRALDRGQAIIAPRGIPSLELVGKAVSSAGENAPVDVFGAQTLAAFPRTVFVQDADVEVFAREWWDRHAVRVSLGERALRAEREQRQAELLPQTTNERLETLAELAANDLQRVRDASHDAEATAVSLQPTNRHAMRLFEADLDLGVRLLDFVERLAEVVQDPQPVIVPARQPWARLLEDAAFEVRQFLAQYVSYLGPLRQDPTVLQRGGQTSAAGDIGTKGELAASVLYAQRDTFIECPELDRPAQRRRLGAALTHWAQYLGIAEEVRTVDLGRLGIELQIRPEGLDHDIDLTNVGVGVSQLLPVLLTCLLAAPGSLVLLEQPELHLHPAMQQRLGDFLLACARSGRQLIVETHSEHLISRLRRWAAEDEADEVVDLFTIVFAELEQGVTHFRTVHANRFGGIDEWPSGFFDQGVAEAREILQAGLLKKQREEPE